MKNYCVLSSGVRELPKAIIQLSCSYYPYDNAETANVDYEYWGGIMRGAILNKGESGYTLMSRVFNAIHNVQKNYNWLISDINAYPSNPLFRQLVNEDYIWLTGDELTKMIETEDFQWIWAVFSGFSPDISKMAALQYEIPNVQDNYDIWKKQPVIQHPLANTEILACDSSYVTIVSKHDKIVSDFIDSFSLAVDLETYINQ